MKRKSVKNSLLTFVILFSTLFGVGSVSGMNPGWVGFHADAKGFPGWTDKDQDNQVTEDMEFLGITLDAEQQRNFSPHDYQGFGGAINGKFTETRPRGKR